MFGGGLAVCENVSPAKSLKSKERLVYTAEWTGEKREKAHTGGCQIDHIFHQILWPQRSAVRGPNGATYKGQLSCTDVMRTEKE